MPEDFHSSALIVCYFYTCERPVSTTTTNLIYMHPGTRKKIDFLQQYIRENAGTLYDKYGDNVTSIRVNKKTTKKKKKTFYAIVFHVIKKKREKQIHPSEIIPKSILIKFPDGKSRAVKTDVKQTGEFRFLSYILDRVHDPYADESGTLGLFLEDNRQNVFALTNYHVAAQHLIRQGIFEYDQTRNRARYDVQIGGFMHRLIRGRFDQELDVAFVGIGPGTTVSNALVDGTDIDTRNFVEGPLDARLRYRPAKVYLRSRGGPIGRQVTDNSAPLSCRAMQFVDMVTVKLCGDDGDSGGLVLANSNQVLGIIVGCDQESTYIIPYFKIHDFFPLQII